MGSLGQQGKGERVQASDAGSAGASCARGMAEAGKREWAVAGWAAGEGWTGLPGFLGLGLVCFLLFPSSFLFLKQTKPNYLNPNSNLNSNLSTQTNKRGAPA